MAALGQGQGQGGEGGEGGDAGAAQQGDAGQNGGGPDLSQLAEALGQQGQSLEQMREFLQSNPWARQPAQESGEEASTLDLSWLDNPAMDPEAQQALVQQSVQSLVDQRAQQLVAPMQNDIREMRQTQQIRDLVNEYPEMATEEVATKIAGPNGLASQMATELAHQMGQPNLAATLAASPIVWKWAYMADKAAELANAEQQGSGDPAAILESGNGAGPGLSGEDLVKGIMEAGGRGGSVLDRM